MSAKRIAAVPDPPGGIAAGALNVDDIDTGRLAIGTAALVTRFLGRCHITVSDRIPGHMVAVVARHALTAHAESRCTACCCTLAREWLAATVRRQVRAYPLPESGRRV